LKILHYKGDARRSFSKGEGCRECFDTGFQGRTGIYEVLPATAELRQLVSEEAGLEAVRKWFHRQGYASLLECGLELAEREQTSLEEVGRIALFE
jgi:type II secretory ATPase GspE/PulE/Tfp pilus assembly ATPase PilB-like protein